MKALIQLILIIITIFGILFSHQNENAILSPDLNVTTSGNQELTGTAPVSAGELLKIDIYIKNASNLDTYEFNVIFNPSELEFSEASEVQPITSENNFLKQNGGSTTGWIATVTAAGTLNVANTLIENNGEATSDGEGLLAHIVFNTLTQTSGILTFSDVYLYDNDGYRDIVSSESDVSLPVELVNFSFLNTTAGVKLQWETASEIENLGFNILRSQDSLHNFLPVNERIIEGRGNCASTSRYSFIDNTIFQGVCYNYLLESVDFNGAKHTLGKIMVNTDESIIPLDFDLKQNFPNPFNNQTKIIYHIPETVNASIIVYNFLGQKIKTLDSRLCAPGIYHLHLNATDFSSGVYFYELKTKKYRKVRKFIVLK